MFTVKQAAHELGVSAPRIYQLIESGALKAEKFGNVWAIEESSIQARKKSPKKAGRPLKQLKTDLRNYTLMNREYAILDFTYDATSNKIVSVGAIKDESRAPLGLLSQQKAKSLLRTFKYWWSHRSIPASRPGIEAKLKQLGYAKTSDIAIDTLGFSLSDQYWVCPENSGFKWRDLNFFDNSFECCAAHETNLLEQVGLKNPDNTSDGNLPKTWVCKGNKRLLLKGAGPLGQEVYNEVLATKLFSKFLHPNEFVSYRKREFGKQLVCECSCFLKDFEEFVPAYYIKEAFAKPNHINWFQHYINCCVKLGVSNVQQFLEKMILLDFILLNHDRHFRNFGLIRNVHTLKWRLAPLFDSGSCLFCNVSTHDLPHAYELFSTKPFYEQPKRQLRLVSDMSWVKIDLLKGFVDEVSSELAQDKTLAMRLPYIADAINKQVSVVEVLK